MRLHERGHRLQRAAHLLEGVTELPARALAVLELLLELLHRRDDLRAEHLDEATLKGADEVLQLRLRRRVHRGVRLVGCARDLPETLGGRLRVQREQCLAEVFGLRTEQRRRDLRLLRGVLHRSQAGQDLTETLLGCRAALGDLRRHLLSVQTEILVRRDRRFRPVDGADRELLDGIRDEVSVTRATLQALVDQTRRVRTRQADLAELRAVLVQRVEQIIALVRAGLETLGDDVERLIGALRHAGTHHLRHGARHAAEILIERL